MGGFKRSNGHIHGDLAVALVAHDLEVIDAKVLDLPHVALDLELGEGLRLPLELLLERGHVVRVHVRVAQSVNKVPGLEPSHVGDHVGEEGVGGDVEGHAEAHVGRALVELAGELAVGGDVELDEAVAGGQGHLGDVDGVPGAHQHPAVVRVGLQRLDDLG